MSLTVKCAKVICCPALGYFLYDYKADLNLTPSLRHFLSNCGTKDVHINHEAHLFVWSIEVIPVKKSFPLVNTKRSSSEVVGYTVLKSLNHF